MRRLAALMMVAIALVGACGSGSSDGPLSAAEIDEALRGNTAVGSFLGERYRQFFDTDGTTAYVPVDGRASFGEWRVDDGSDTYESLWAADIWETYEVHRIDDALHWVGDGFDPQPFQVLPGQQVTIPN